jgi:hypothetical protein
MEWLRSLWEFSVRVIIPWIVLTAMLVATLWGIGRLLGLE